VLWLAQWPLVIILQSLLSGRSRHRLSRGSESNVKVSTHSSSKNEQAVFQEERSFWNLFQNNVTQLYPPLDQIQERKVALELARAEFDLVSSAVSLIGASDTSDQVEALNEAHDEFYETVDYALRLATTSASAEQSQEVDAEFDSTADSVNEAHDGLLRLLRRDSDLRNWLRDTPVDLAFRDRTIPESS